MKTTMSQSRSFVATILAAAFAVGAMLPLGGGAMARDKTSDQDVARQAVERGEIKELAIILAAVRSKLPGEVVRVKVEQKRGRWFYEFRVADAKGRLFEVYVDAQTAAIEKIEEK